jgi:hypothetical protein
MAEIVREGLRVLETPAGQLIACFVLLLTVSTLAHFGVDLNNGAVRDVLVALLVMLRPGSRQKEPGSNG